MALVTTLPVMGDPSSRGLQGSPGLGGGKRLQSGQAGLQGASRLKAPRIQSAGHQSAAKVQAAQPLATTRRVDRATLKNAAAGIARQDLTESSLQGAATRIPKSQIGALLFDVAGELEQMEVDMGAEAVGYYMAALADPEGDQYEAAKRRLRQIFLHSDLSHEEAVRLYDGGWSIFTELSKPRIGLTPEGLASARRDLRELKSAYHRRRAVRADDGNAGGHAGQGGEAPRDE